MPSYLPWLIAAACLATPFIVYALSRPRRYRFPRGSTRAERRFFARRRRDDLMALADSLRLCGAVGRASELGHLWHDCHLGAGHPTDLGAMHYCRCGQYYRTPAYVSHEISALEAMLDDPVEPDGRTR